MSEAVVFVGPSLPPGVRPCHQGIDYREPAGHGDIYRAANAGAPVIGLIDGLFEHTRAVWHREILYALKQGVHVVGGASMGALRACELAPFGVEGVGEVYQAYADGIIDADDEVALLHGPGELGYHAMSEPLVNIRATLAAAREAGVISEPTAVQLLETSRATFYHNRTLGAAIDRLAEEAGLAGELSQLRQRLDELSVDIKRDDALRVIERVLDLASTNSEPREGGWTFPRTMSWTRYVEGDDLPDQLRERDARLVDELRLSGCFERHIDSAMLQLALDRPDMIARLRKPSIEEKLRVSASIRRRRGLAEKSSFAEWRRHRAVSQEEYDRAVVSQSLKWKIWLVHRHRVLPLLVSQVKFAGHAAQLEARAAVKHRALAVAAGDASRRRTDLSLDQLVEYLGLGEQGGDGVTATVAGLLDSWLLDDPAKLRGILEREWQFRQSPDYAPANVGGQ